MKDSSKLNNKNAILASLAFGWISIFWFGYDNLIQTINIATFGLRVPISGLILAIDNILGLFMLPLFGWLSDRCKSRMGKRTPFILIGTVASMIGFVGVGIFANKQILWGYILCLIVTLASMAMYRSPALSLVPDITPEPLRSKANAVSNIVSAVFTLIGIAIVMPFLTAKYISANNYYPIVIGIVISTFATLGFFLFKVKEPKLLKECDLQLENMEKESTVNMVPELVVPEKKIALWNKIFVLLTVFFFYMAYNALVSNFSNYAYYVLKLEFRSLPLVVIMVGALVGFALTGKVTEKLGRKKAILLGLVIMAVAFLFAAAFVIPQFAAVTPDIAEKILINIAFAVAGSGYGFVIVNIYPMFIELSGKHVGRGTGVYSSAITLAMVITPILSGAIIEQIGKSTGMTYSTTIGTQVITNFGDFRMLVPYSAVFLLLAIVSTALVRTRNDKKFNLSAK